MSNEIWHSYDSSYTLYAFVYRMDDTYIWDVGDSAFEAMGTWNDARADECDIPMTAVGDMHFADWPDVGGDDGERYLIQIRRQPGANPDTDDTVVAQAFVEWSESEQVIITPGTIVDSAAKIVNVFGEEPEEISASKSRIYL